MRANAKTPGPLGWTLVSLVLVGSLPGVIQAVLRMSGAAGLSELPVLSDWDWLTGLLSFHGPVVAIVPLLIATFLQRIQLRSKVMLWVVFLLSIAGLVLFGQDIERALGSSPR